MLTPLNMVITLGPQSEESRKLFCGSGDPPTILKGMGIGIGDVTKEAPVGTLGCAFGVDKGSATSAAWPKSAVCGSKHWKCVRESMAFLPLLRMSQPIVRVCCPLVRPSAFIR